MSAPTPASNPVTPPAERPAHVEVRDLKVAFGERVILRDITFTVRRGDIFVIMGGSGSGKSTLLKTMIGLIEPASGDVLYNGESFTHAEPQARSLMLRGFGVTYQKGALWGGLTLAENIALVLEQYTDLAPAEIRDLAAFKLALVGLSGFEDYYPAAISGGMQKRAALARSMALDPEVLFFDEPSAGLDPPTSRRLDELIVELRDSLSATVVIVTHELASLLAIGDNGAFVDAQEKTMIAQGSPRELLESCADERVQQFLRRGPGVPAGAPISRREA